MRVVFCSQYPHKSVRFFAYFLQVWRLVVIYVTVVPFFTFVQSFTFAAARDIYHNRKPAKLTSRVFLSRFTF